MEGDLVEESQTRTYLVKRSSDLECYNDEKIILMEAERGTVESNWINRINKGLDLIRQERRDNGAA